MKFDITTVRGEHVASFPSMGEALDFWKRHQLHRQPIANRVHMHLDDLPEVPISIDTLRFPWCPPSSERPELSNHHRSNHVQLMEGDLDNIATVPGTFAGGDAAFLCVLDYAGAKKQGLPEGQFRAIPLAVWLDLRHLPLVESLNVGPPKNRGRKVTPVEPKSRPEGGAVLPPLQVGTVIDIASWRGK